MDISQSKLGLVNEPTARSVAAPGVARRANSSTKDIEIESTPVKTVDVRELAKQANAALQARSSNIEFQVDSASGRTILRVIDSQSKEVLRQIPSEELLAISSSLDRILRGLLVRDSA